MRLRCITPEILEEIKTEGVVSNYDRKRMLEVANMGSQDEDTYVFVMPNDAQYKTKVKWTTDSGVRKSCCPRSILDSCCTRTQKSN